MSLKVSFTIVGGVQSSTALNALVSDPSIVQNAVVNAITSVASSSSGVTITGTPSASIVATSVPANVTIPVSSASVLNNIVDTSSLLDYFINIGAVLKNNKVPSLQPISNDVLITAFGGSDFLNSFVIFSLQTAYNSILDAQIFPNDLLKTLAPLGLVSVLSDYPVTILDNLDTKNRYTLTVDSTQIKLSVSVEIYDPVTDTYGAPSSTDYFIGDSFCMNNFSYTVLNHCGNSIIIQKLSVVLNSLNLIGSTLEITFYNPSDSLTAFSWNRTTLNQQLFEPGSVPLVIIGPFETRKITVYNVSPSFDPTFDYITWDIYGDNAGDWGVNSIKTGTMLLEYPLLVENPIARDRTVYDAYIAKKTTTTLNGSPIQLMGVTLDPVNYDCIGNTQTLNITVTSSPGIPSYIITDEFGKLLVNSDMFSIMAATYSEQRIIPDSTISNFNIYVCVWKSESIKRNDNLNFVKSYVISTSSPAPTSVLTYDFDNCSATVVQGATVDSASIDTVHIEWFPLIGAASYKIFGRYGYTQSATGKIYTLSSVNKSPTIPDDPADDKESSNTSNSLYQFQTAAITSTSYDFVTSGNPPTSPYTDRKITFYLYAYSDSAGTTRMTNFPIKVLQCIGYANSLMFLTRSTCNSSVSGIYEFTDDGTSANDSLEVIKTKSIP